MEQIPGRNGGRLNRPKKGDPSPNPAGRPKGIPNAKTVIKKWLAAQEKAKNPLTGEFEDLSELDLITLAQLQKARKGDTQAFNALLDRMEGKPKQVTEEIGEQKIVVTVKRNARN